MRCFAGDCGSLDETQHDIKDLTNIFLQKTKAVIIIIDFFKA